MATYLIPLCLAVAVFLLTRSALARRTTRASQWRDAVLGRQREQAAERPQPATKSAGLRSRSLLERAMRVPPRLSAPADRLIAAAGLSDRFTGTWLVGLSAVSASSMLLLFTLATASHGVSGAELAIAPLVTALGGAAPWVLVSGRAGRRREAIERALPDTLDLLTVSIEAGLALEAALVRVSERHGGPLTEELQRTLSEMRLGRRRPEALQGLAQRTDVQPVAQLVNALNHADRSGMQLGPVLRTQADQIRQRRRQRAEESAMKAPVKMLFPLVAFIFPAMFLVIMGPAVINLIESMKG